MLSLLALRPQLNSILTEANNLLLQLLHNKINRLARSLGVCLICLNSADGVGEIFTQCALLTDSKDSQDVSQDPATESRVIPGLTY